jgi:hypothetical protein
MSTFSYLLLSLVALSCVLGSTDVIAQRKLIPVTDSVPAFDAGWASVAPPGGKEWFVFDANRNAAIFGKKLSPKHSFIAAVFLKTVDSCCKDAQELAVHTRAQLEANTKQGRNRIVTQEAEITSWDSLACVSYRIVAEDRGSNVAPGEPLNYFQRGLNCLRPGSPGEIIELSYSERGGQLEGSPELVSEGESFLKGLKRSQDK